MKVFLIGLRRSGTTTLLQQFRQDHRMVCFDEPFNPLNRDIPDHDEWGTKAEYVNLYHENPHVFWQKYAYIDGQDEIRDDLTSRQIKWIAYLLESAPNTFMDFTRGHFKIPDLFKLAPDALLVHLHRSPAAFAGSHILPSIWKNKRHLKYWRQKNRFWKIKKKYNFWGMETIIGRSERSFCAERFLEFGINPEAVYMSNAATRLVAFWLLNYRVARQEGSRLFGDRYIQIPFEWFSTNPEAYMSEIYRQLDSAPPEFDFSEIRKAPPSFFPDHAGWQRIRDALNIDPQEIEIDGDLIL